MNFSVVDILLWLSWALNLLIAGVLMAKAPQRRVAWALALFSIVSGFWALGVTLFRTLPADPTWVLAANILLISAGGFIAPTFLHFALRFTEKKISSLGILALYLPAFAFATLSWVPGALISTIYLQPWGRASELGFAYPFFTAYFILYYCIGFAVLFYTYQQAEKPSFRRQLGQITLATFITCTIDVIFNVILVAAVNYRFVWVGPLSGFIWVSILAYSIAKHELLGIRVVINRAAAFAITALLFTAGYLALIWGIALFTHHPPSGLFLGISILYGGFVVGLYFHRVQRFVQTTAHRKFLKLHYDFEGVLIQTSQQLSTINSTDDVLGQLMSLLHSLEVGQSYVILRASMGYDCYQLLLNEEFSSISTGTRRFIRRFVDSDPLISDLQALRKSVIFYSDLPPNIQGQLGGFPIHPQSVCLMVAPLNHIEVIFVVGPKLSEERYNIRDLALFEVVVNQAVLVFERIEKMEQLAHSNAHTEALNRELAQLNQHLEEQVVEEVNARNQAVLAAQALANKAMMSTLTAGISHEIRNPLTSIKANVENLLSRLSGKVGEDLYPWKGSLTLEALMELGGISQAQAEAILEALHAQHYVEIDGQVTPQCNPFYDSIALHLPDSVQHFTPQVIRLLGEKFKQKQVMDYLELINRESVRVVSITNAMLQYGSVKGIGQEAFAKLSGFTAEKSAKLWQELVKKKYLDAYGGILSRFSPQTPGFKLELSERFKPFHDAIVGVLASLPDAQKTMLDPGLPIGHVLQLKQSDFSKHRIQASLERQHSHLILGDQNRLFQILNILVSNAIEAMESEPASKPRSLLVSTQDAEDNGVLISVADSGCGMPEDIIQKVKDPFFTTKGVTGGKNAGLGMSILFDIMENHGGTVDIASVPREGTTITLWLPG